MLASASSRSNSLIILNKLRSILIYLFRQYVQNFPIAFNITSIKCPPRLHNGTNQGGIIFSYSVPQIWLNLSEDIGYIVFKGICPLRLLAIALRLQETPKFQSGQISRSWWPSPLQEIIILSYCLNRIQRLSGGITCGLNSYSSIWTKRN